MLNSRTQSYRLNSTFLQKRRKKSPVSLTQRKGVCRMETSTVEHLIMDQVHVSPKIRLLNKYVQKAQKVAISSINPIYTNNELAAFSVEVEGTPKHMSYFKRLIASDASLRVS